jgi:hypothetical protein
MKTPRTRVDEGTTELERELLRSWAAEAPTSPARRKALGIAVTTAGAAAAGTAAGATGTAVAQGLVPKATAAAVLALGKWLAVGGVVVTGALIARPHLLVSAPSSVVAVAPSSAAPSARPAPPLEPAAASPPAEVVPPTPTAEPALALPSAPTAFVRRASRAKHLEAEPPVVAAPAAEAAPPEPKRAARALGEQVASLDRAERALAAGDAAEALRLVDDYESRFPTGSLLQEATVVRVDALMKLGRHDAASAVGDAFLSSHPTSPYAAKLRRRLQGGTIP